VSYDLEGLINFTKDLSRHSRKDCSGQVSYRLSNLLTPWNRVLLEKLTRFSAN
jgi:hypothetical protein